MRLTAPLCGAFYREQLSGPHRGSWKALRWPSRRAHVLGVGSVTGPAAPGATLGPGVRHGTIPRSTGHNEIGNGTTKAGTMSRARRCRQQTCTFRRRNDVRSGLTESPTTRPCHGWGFCQPAGRCPQDVDVMLSSSTTRRQVSSTRAWPAGGGAETPRHMRRARTAPRPGTRLAGLREAATPPAGRAERPRPGCGAATPAAPRRVSLPTSGSDARPCHRRPAVARTCAGLLLRQARDGANRGLGRALYRYAPGCDVLLLRAGDPCSPGTAKAPGVVWLSCGAFSTPLRTLFRRLTCYPHRWALRCVGVSLHHALEQRGVPAPVSFRFLPDPSFREPHVSLAAVVRT